MSMVSMFHSGASSGAQLLVSIGSALYDIWVEAVVIALALHLYLRLSRSSSSILKQIDKAFKPPKVINQSVTPKKISAPVESQEEKEVRAWIANVLSKEGQSRQEADTYENFVRSRQIDLRNHIADDQTARSFYLALMEGHVQKMQAGSQVASASFSGSKPVVSRYLADMRIFGFPRGHEFYSAVLKIHVVARLYADSLWLYDVMTADGITPDRTMCIHLLSVAVSCGQHKKALSFFKEASRMGPPPMRTYMTILRVYTKEQDWRGAVEVLNGLQKAGGAPDALVLNTVLGLCVSEGRVDIAEKLLEQFPGSADVVSCNVVLKGYTQLVNWPKCDRLLKRMLDGGPAPNIISFNTIMDCAVRALVQAHGGARPQPQHQRGETGDQDRPAAEASLAQRPWQLLDQLLALNLEPDRYTCSTLVKGLHLTGASAREIDRAVDLVRKIGPAGLHAAGAGSCGGADGSNARLLEVLFNTLLDACVSLRDLDRMAEIFQMMGAFEVEVSAVTFSTLIKAFGQAGQLSHCHEVWQNMMDANVKPTIVTFGCYIDVCIRGQDMAAAERVFEAMGDAGVKPNTVVYTSMIRGYAHSKQPMKALDLYRRMQAEGIQGTAVTFNSVLDMMVRQLADPKRLEEIVEDMRAASVAPDVATYSILIKASCNAGHVDSAVALFRQLRAHGLAFDEVAFNTLLLACSKAEQVDVADEILGEMRTIGMVPTQVTISILVKMYGKAKMLDKAIELSSMMEKQYGMTPNLHVFTCLIQACVRNRQIRKSWEVFGSMLRTGVAPDAITYGTLVHGCIYNNRFEQGMAFVRHAYGLVKGSSLLQSLSLGSGDAGASSSLQSFGQVVRLQQDVLKMLVAALKRKGQSSLLAELEAIVAKHGHAHALCGKEVGRSRSHGEEVDPID